MISIQKVDVELSSYFFHGRQYLLVDGLIWYQDWSWEDSET